MAGYGPFTNGDFESGLVGWINSSDVSQAATVSDYLTIGGSFAGLGSVTPHNGANMGVIVVNEATPGIGELHQDFVVPDAPDAALDFWIYLESSVPAYDSWHQSAEIRDVNTDAVLFNIYTFNAPNSGWALIHVDLSPWRGIPIRFAVKSVAVFATAGKVATFLDDAVVSGTTGPPTDRFGADIMLVDDRTHTFRDPELITVASMNFGKATINRKSKRCRVRIHFPEGVACSLLQMWVSRIPTGER